MTTSAETARTRVERRYWRKTETPASLWPWGLLPLLGLLLLFIYGFFNTSRAIQQQTLESVKQQLIDSGINIDDIKADGRRIHISGNAVNLDEHQIRAIARGTECDTWLGELVCPTSVSVEMTAPQPNQVAADSGDEKAPEIANARHLHDFEFTRDGPLVTLNGNVPTVEKKNELAAHAAAAFASVKDELIVTNKPVTGHYQPMTSRALEILARMQSGSVRWVDGKLHVAGTVSPEQEQVIRGLLGSIQVGEISLIAQRLASDCNTRFNDLLRQSDIRFSTNSADIDSTSSQLLRELANLAGECPGTITISGHTDNVGDEAMNLQLSQARAAAVREALTALGVVADRLEARGYGETRPVADNSTRAGRAQNRRITIQIKEDT